MSPDAIMDDIKHVIVFTPNWDLINRHAHICSLFNGEFKSNFGLNGGIGLLFSRACTDISDKTRDVECILYHFITSS